MASVRCCPALAAPLPLPCLPFPAAPHPPRRLTASGGKVGLKHLSLFVTQFTPLAQHCLAWEHGGGGRRLAHLHGRAEAAVRPCGGEGKSRGGGDGDGRSGSF